MAEQDEGGGTGLPSVMTVDDFDKMNAQAPDVSGAKVGDETVSDIVAERERLKAALRNSESLRVALEAARAPAAPVVIQQAAPVQQHVQELTDEQVNELFQQNPIAAVQYMQDKALRQAAGHFEARIEAIAGGSVAAQEASAKQRYAEEFELFGEEIERAKRSLPDRSMLSSPQAWDQLIGFIRGQPGNIDKLIEKRIAARGSDAAATARATQIQSHGFVSGTPVTDVRVPSGETHGLSAAEMRAADQLGVSYADYKKWK